MPHQEALTIVAKVDPLRFASLEDVMGVLRKNPAQNDVLSFGALPGLHFGRLVLLPATKDLSGVPLAPQLLMLTDCDGPAAQHLESIVDAAGDGIDQVFGHCENYPRGKTSRDERIAFLRANTVDAKANYVHRQGRTVTQIRREAELRQALQTFVGERRFVNVPPLEVRRQLRTYLASTPALSWALEPAEGVGIKRVARDALHFTTLPLGLVAFGPVILPATLLTLLLVRLQELRDNPPHIRPTPEHAQKLAELEDFVAHNGFTAGGFVKPGRVRQAVMAAVLPLIGWGTRHLFTRDSLAGVKTIHFARWIPIDGGKRVVFASNYDGSLEAYNNDFIDLVAWGLNLVFANGQGYPRTRWLVFEGASREQEFKDFLRSHQIPTPVWYSAYPTLTAENVVRNAKLRAGLSGPMTESEAQRWLRLL